MKRTAIGPIVVALSVATAGGSVYGQDARGRAGADSTRPPASTEQKSPTDSQAFINDLTIAGLAEVQLGKLAAERAMNPDVKTFGQMMVKDHTQAANELKPIAMQLNAQQPT